MKKINLIFALLLSLMGVTQVKAETLTANFNSGLPEGWSLVGDLTNDDSRARSGKGIWTSSKSTTDNYVVTEAVEGTFEFYARAYNKSYASTVVVYEYTGSGLGAQLFTTNSMYTSSTPSWSKFSFTIQNGTQLAIVLNYAAIDDVTYTPYVQTDGPGFAAYDGTTKLTSPYSFDFGLATEGTTKTFTLKNPGTADVNVSVSETGSFGATLSATTIAVGGEATLTLTMPETTGSSVVTVTPTGLDPFVINVSGTIRDANKVYEFGFTSLPEDWTTTGSWSYSAANGAYTTSWYLSSNSRLITPLLTVSEGETFFVEAKGYSTSNTSYQHLQMQYSADGTTWTNFGSEPTLDPSSWNTYSFTGVPAGQYYIAINASQADVRMFYGGELPQVAKMVVTAEDHNFGLITEETSTTFTIQNTGRAQLTGIQVSSSNAAFTIENAPASLAIDEEATVTVKMSAANTGEFNGIITVKADDQEDVTFNVSGVVLPEGLSVIDFEDNQLPSGWEQATSNKWSFADGKAYVTSAAEMVTSKLQFADGDLVAIMATSYDNYDNNYLEVYASSNEGTSWTLLKKFVSRSQIPYGSYAPLILSSIPASTNMLKFKGYYVRIEEIRGLTFDQNAPVLTVDPTTAADFGNKVKAQPEAKTYTITNSGTGILEGTISSSDETQFTVSVSEFSIAAGESMTFDIALVFDENYGEKSATITVHPTNEGLQDVTIAATATTKDPNVWEEDFEGGSIPAEWTNVGWSVSTPSSYLGGNGTKMAGPGSNKNATLITPRLKATEGQELQYYVHAEDATYFVKAEYSTDLSEWTEIATYTTAGTQTFVAPADGSYYLRFTGYYTYVDDFVGFQLDQLAADFVITGSTLPTSGKQFATYTASVTVENKGTEAQTAVAKLYFGEENVDTQEAELAVNGSATISLTYQPIETMTKDVRIEVTLKGVEIDAKTVSQEDVVISEATILDEETAWEYDADADYSTIALNYNPKNGWNTIALPFGATNDQMTQIFGEGWKAYYYDNYENGELKFKKATFFRKNVPFVVYVENARDDEIPVVFSGLDISSDGASSEDWGGASFVATYAPIAAPGMQGKYGVVPSTGKIQKGGANASLKGFRGYFELPAGASGAKINFYDENDNLVNAIDAVELQNALNGDLYDLSGRKVAGKAKAGVYIQNGKKVVVK